MLICLSKMNRKIIKLIKWSLLLSLIFSSLYLFNYSYFKGNDGMFLLNALDTIGAKPLSYAPAPFFFDIDSLDWVFFAPPGWKKSGSHWLGLLACRYQYKTPFTDPAYFISPDDEKRDAGVISFFYLNLQKLQNIQKNNQRDPCSKAYFRLNSAISFSLCPPKLTPDDYKIIESFQNTKRVPYLKSIALEIKAMPFFLKSELNYIKTDQNILLEMPILVLTVLFSIPYLYLQVIIPSSLSVPFFWLWITFSIFYIIIPYKTLKRIGEKIKERKNKRITS